MILNPPTAAAAAVSQPAQHERRGRAPTEQKAHDEPDGWEAVSGYVRIFLRGSGEGAQPPSIAPIFPGEHELARGAEDGRVR
jgi:hypothetical protein